jgi:hypothetical protein
MPSEMLFKLIERVSSEDHQTICFEGIIRLKENSSGLNKNFKINLSKK